MHRFAPHYAEAVFVGGMAMQGMQMMPQMRAHMDSMMRVSPQQMQSMMAQHEAMMSRMLDFLI